VREQIIEQSGRWLDVAVAQRREGAGEPFLPLQLRRAFGTSAKVRTDDVERPAGQLA
jgi:hypothetical protein